MKRLIALVVAMSVVAVASAEVWTDPQTGLQWTYMPTSNGEATIGDGLTAAIPTDTAGELTLPSEINALPVTIVDGWTLVSEGREADYNFFKVTVEMK